MRDLSRGHINLYAMGLVYATLLSLIPLIAFAFAVLKAFGAHRELSPVIEEFFHPLGTAGAADLTHRVMEFADSVSTGLVGSVGLALLLWTLLGTIKKVEERLQLRLARGTRAQLCPARHGVHRAADRRAHRGREFHRAVHRALDSTAGFSRYMPFWDRLTSLALEAAPFFMESPRSLRRCTCSCPTPR